MKKWKQILALTLAVVVTLSVVPVGDARAAVEEPTEYAIVGEIINADGAEITVREVSKDGTENVELPWEELEEDTQNSDTEKDTKIFYTDELEAGKDYLIEVQPKEDYKIVLDEENDFEEKGEGYQYAFSCTEDNNFFRFKAEAQKTTGEMTLNIVTDGKSDFSGGSVTVYKIKEDGEEECTPSESAQGVKKYNVNAENDYRIEVKPDRDAGYEFQNNQKPDDYTYDEEKDIYYKTFSCTTEKLSYSEQISFALKKVKIKLELSEGGGIQIGNTAYNKSEEIDCKYGDTFENVKIIPKPGYIIKSATWNDGELTILQDEDTVGKVSLPALKEDAALTVSFEQAEVEQEAQFPDDIEIVFSNAQDENTREVSEDGITYSISKGQTVTIKSKSGKSISFNNEKKSVLGAFWVRDYEQNKILDSEKTINNIWELESPWNIFANQIGYELKKPVTFIFDTVPPTVTVTENGKAVENGYKTWITGKEDNIVITGNVTDAGTEGSNYLSGADRVVWSTEPLTEDKILAEEEHVAAVTEDGTFSIQIDVVPQEDTEVYLYGVDKASNVNVDGPVIRGYQVDKSAPVITDIQAPSLIEKRNVYYTRDAKVTFTVKTADEQSGVKSITIYQDGVAKATKNVDSSNSATFTITLSDTAENKITASATDKVGNTMAPENYGSFANGAKIVHDITVPEIKADLAHFYVDTNMEGVTTYYEKQDETINFSIEQKKSGLNSVNVTINGTSLTEDKNGKSLTDANRIYKDVQQEMTTKDTFVISTSQVSAVGDGDYEIKIAVTANVDEKDVYTKTIHVHKENQAPVVTDFQVIGASKETVSDTGNYGYYANTDVTAEITVSDGNTGAGIQSISYHLTDADGTEEKEVTVECRKRPGEDAVIRIPIQAEFKGYIYLKATDNVENVSLDYYKSVGILLERSEAHESNRNVVIETEKTDTTDGKGNPLYASDTSVAVSIEDPYAGIRSIEWSVNAPYDTGNNRNGIVTVDNNGAISDEAWKITTADRNLVTGVSGQIPVFHNSNDIVVNVKVTDCAGNVTEKAVTISIDKTAPEISISYNDIAPDSIYTSVYKDVRVATVTVRERNFDENDIAWNLISTHGAEAQISGWTEYTEEGNPDNSVHMATVTFAADDDYRFSMSGRDRAGNNATTFPEQTFTIDRTNPVIEVTMDGQAANGNYYAQDRTATIKVTEHNFDAGRIEVYGTAADNGQTTVFPALSGWTTDGDVHMATISFAVDGNYAFTVDAMDEAGNAAVQSSTSEFVIDKTEPVIEISGIENDSANNDVVMPVVQFSDTNYNEGAATIELSGANHGIVHYDGAFAQTENGQTFTFSDFAHEQDVDDIYTLTAREIDFAGNETEQSITFSVNRFGSVYVLDDSLKEIEGTYIKEPIDIVLTETNVDSLSMDTIKITVSANGEPKNLEEGTDYTITSVGGNGSWSQYTYKIDKSVFQGDGSYLVTVYSEDNAGNINENINESKQAEIGFGVDGTAPVIVPINIEEGQSYNTQNYEATVSVIDNLVLQDIKVILNGQTLSYTQDGDDISFSIPESDKRQTVAISAKDAAGNEVDCEIADLLVSTNSLIRLLNNTPAVIAIVCGVAVVGVGTGVFAGLRRKRTVHIKRKN